jgi:glycosyltransferase involved in cell wall biosynthesis
MYPTISFIIPTYNRAHTLAVAIKSVFEQSAGNWELIIIDDGSTDNTQEVLKTYLRDERIKYYFQQNKGVSVARNKGVELSQGDFLIFLDSDDRFLPGLISRLNEINFKNYDLVCWQVLKKIDGNYSVWKPQKLEKIYNNITATFLAGSACYKKEVFLQAGGFDPKMSFGENYELGLRISERKGLKIKVLNEQFLYYVINSNSRESNSLINRLDSYRNLYNKHIKKFQRDRRSHSQILYLLGFVHEKLGMKTESKKLYYSSFSANPLNYKAFLKSIYFKVFGK